ncbi:MAG: diaminopimelate epimerase [Bacteroidota bacterium]|nr:diaminopimelate epimerase [Bacteroidota bacterium]
MKIHIYKYQGTGNDFVMIDGRDGITLSDEQIVFLCNRNFGVGSDGLIILRNSVDYDFQMEFYNPDGSEATFCGNGARCIVKFAQKLNIIDNECTFVAKDGKHSAQIIDDKVKLQMIDVENIRAYDDLIYMNTGTHHSVVFVDNVDTVEINESAPKIRFDDRFAPDGTNVNFIQKYKTGIKVRTFEKGVEAETLSCGTGVVASALAFAIKNNISGRNISVYAKGGDLSVDFNKNINGFVNVFLTGMAKFVFDAYIELEN